MIIMMLKIKLKKGFAMKKIHALLAFSWTKNARNHPREDDLEEIYKKIMLNRAMCKLRTVRAPRPGEEA